jgi:hypothetical protein
MRAALTSTFVVIVALTLGVGAALATGGNETPTSDVDPTAVPTEEPVRPLPSPTLEARPAEVRVVLTDYDVWLEEVGEPIQFLEGSRLQGREAGPPCDFVLPLSAEQAADLERVGETRVVVPALCPQFLLIQVHVSPVLRPDGRAEEEVRESTRILTLDGLTYRSESMRPVPMGPLDPPAPPVQLPSTGSGSLSDSRLPVALLVLVVTSVAGLQFLVSRRRV